MKKINKQGFTIIEVVLVLAIAGLIFVVVFLAVPQLQASRRDSARRNDVGRVLAALQEYAANNNGTYPSAWDAAPSSFASRYLDDLIIEDPSTGDYRLSANFTTSTPTVPTAVGNMVVAIGSTCNGELFASGGSRDVAVMVALDDGDVTYCQDIR